MEDEINAAWEACSACDEKEYVKAFRAVNEEKALLYAKKIIDDTESVVCDLDVVEFPKEVTNVREKDEVVQILTAFGVSDQYNAAVDLLLAYFSRRPDIGKEVCYGITERMGIHIRSNEQGYSHEKYLISKLYERYKESVSTEWILPKATVLACP